MKIGFTSTTFRQIKSLDKIIEIALDSKVDCIEWGGDIHVKTVETAKIAKEKCDKVGLEICSYGAYYKIGSGEYTKWEETCAIANALGAKSIRVWLGTKGSEKTDDLTFKKMVADAKHICEYAKSKGLIVAPECHLGTYNDDTKAFLKFHDAVGCDNFKTYFQSKYKNIGVDKYRIDHTIDLIETVHISYSEQMREQIFASKDKNYIDKIVAKLKEKNYDSYVLLEYTLLAMPKHFKSDFAKLRTVFEK